MRNLLLTILLILRKIENDRFPKRQQKQYLSQMNLMMTMTFGSTRFAAIMKRIEME